MNLRFLIFQLLTVWSTTWKTGPRIIQGYKKLISEKSSTDGYNLFLMAYARSPFRVFESYLRIVVGLDENDIQLILKQ